MSIDVANLRAWQSANPNALRWWKNVGILQTVAAVTGSAAILGLFAAVGYFYTHRPGAPASVNIEGSLLTVLDNEGRPVWRRHFDIPAIRAGEHPGLQHQFVDIDHDGQLETVGVWQHELRDANGWGVHCFSADGKLRWQLLLDDRVQAASGIEFGPPYVVRSFAIFESPERDGTQWVAAVFVHVIDVFSTLVVVDSNGKRRGQYWHSGHLNAVRMFDADGDGKKDIVAGGVRHGAEQAVIVAFDPSRVSGANAMPDKHPRAILGKGPSSEKRVALLARSQLSQRLGSFNFVTNLQVVNGNLIAQTYESVLPPVGYLNYEFAPGLRIENITMSVAFEDANRLLYLRKDLPQLVAEKELGRLRREFRLESHN